MTGNAKRAAAILVAVGITGCGSTKTVTTTVTHTVTTASPACINAIKSTTQAVTLLSRDLRATGQFIPLIAEAAKAGEAKSPSQFATLEAKEKRVNDEVGSYAKQLGQLNASTQSAASCS